MLNGRQNLGKKVCDQLGRLEPSYTGNVDEMEKQVIFATSLCGVDPPSLVSPAIWLDKRASFLCKFS